VRAHRDEKDCKYLPSRAERPQADQEQPIPSLHAIAIGCWGSEMSDDHRFALYKELHKRHTADEPQRIYTAERVLRLVYDKINFGSVLDVGCGRGLWLAVAAELGATETIGIEGTWIEAQATYIGLERILTRDLEFGFNLNRSFDLVMSIEVGEHLSAAAADTFVTSLVRHGHFILFSAAIPFQPGTGHINCQFPDYWARLFAKHDYQPLDFIRRAIWSDHGMHVWIRQNVIAFVSTEFMVQNSWARELGLSLGPLSIVHPELFAALIKGHLVDAAALQGLFHFSCVIDARTSSMSCAEGRISRANLVDLRFRRATATVVFAPLKSHFLR
jgi:SAM-dependent methyltransferase